MLERVTEIPLMDLEKWLSTIFRHDKAWTGAQELLRPLIERLKFLEARRDELQAANNAYLERARKAEALAARLIQTQFPAEPSRFTQEFDNWIPL